MEVRGSYLLIVGKLVESMIEFVNLHQFNDVKDLKKYFIGNLIFPKCKENS